MTTHVEWLRAVETTVSAFAPDESGSVRGVHRQQVLTLAQDDVVAIEGTPAELRALAARITAVVTVATHLQHDPTQLQALPRPLGGDGPGRHCRRAVATAPAAAPHTPRVRCAPRRRTAHHHRGKPLLRRVCAACGAGLLGSHDGAETCWCALPCPTCPAEVGRPCRRPTQHAVFGNRPHDRRVRLAQVDTERRASAGDPDLPARWPPTRPSVEDQPALG